MVSFFSLRSGVSHPPLCLCISVVRVLLARHFLVLKNSSKNFETFPPFARLLSEGADYAPLPDVQPQSKTARHPLPTLGVGAGVRE